MNGHGGFDQAVDGYMNLQGFMHLQVGDGGGSNLQGFQLSPNSTITDDHDHHHHHYHHHIQQQQQQQQISSICPPSLAVPANNSGAGSNSTIGCASAGAAAPPSRYESQKRRDWNTFGQYLKNHRPPLALAKCSGAHVLEFLRYLDQFGKTKVHTQGCPFFGHPQPPSACACPLRQAWGSLDALIGRLRAAFEENGGKPESNPFGARAVRLYLRDVRETQAKARGIAYEKKKRKRPPPPAGTAPASTSASSKTGPDHRHHHHQASMSTSDSSSTVISPSSILPSHGGESVYSPSSVAHEMGMNHHDNTGGAADTPLHSTSLGISGRDHAYHHHHLPQAAPVGPPTPPALIPSFN